MKPEGFVPLTTAPPKYNLLICGSNRRQPAKTTGFVTHDIIINPQYCTIRLDLRLLYHAQYGSFTLLTESR